jgi:hypothetical protein
MSVGERYMRVMLLHAVIADNCKSYYSGTCAA